MEKDQNAKRDIFNIRKFRGDFYVINQVQKVHWQVIAIVLTIFFGGLFVIFNYSTNHRLDGIEKTKPVTPAQISSIPSPFSPIQSQGKRVVVDSNPPFDEELEAVWQNLPDPEDRKMNKIPLFKSQKSLCDFTATGNGNGTDSDEIEWKIQAKRDALGKVALTLIQLYENEDKAHESFLYGRLNKLTFNPNKKGAVITFSAKCPL